eukprot:NODE_441_length_8548_cov_0.413185.p1 type:complete len:399 gc:universal NODE_441_length_8548_cov_0.413185:760-1956(+)
MFDDISEIVHIPQKYKRITEDVKIENKYVENTCTVCKLTFDNSDDARFHHKSDGHLQNLLSNLNASDSEDEMEDIVIVDKDQLLVFKSNGNTFGIFPQLLNDEIWNALNAASLNDYLRKLNNQKWLFLMLSGGDFAGALIDVASQKAIIHKSIHRYTTRRKQGGGQSSHDQSKGKASSAGSSIRRHNEQALVQDIINFLTSNKELKIADLIWIYGAKKNELILKNCIKTASIDIELRKVPISVGKPTSSSLMKCFQYLIKWQNASFEKIKLEEISVEVDNSEYFESEIELEPVIPQEVTKKNKKKKKRIKKGITKDMIVDEVIDLRVPLPEAPTAKEQMANKLIRPVDRIPDRNKMLEAAMRRNNTITCACGSGIDIKNSFEKQGIKYCSINCLRVYS